MGLGSDIRRVWKTNLDVLRGSLAGRRLTKLQREAIPPEPGTLEIAVYFADDPVNLYQIRQWYAPLEELAKQHPVVIISRVAATALAVMAETTLPVVYARKVTALERLIARQPMRLVFYVNQNTKNFQMLRYGRRWHVFVNHGESDKMYMTSNQFKAYDFALIAGDAARARLGRALWDYELDRRTLAIGRPQADHFAGELPYAPDERQVVLYAPTWEGDRPAAAYGSILSHGVALVRSLLATGAHRVIYRPHPRSGVLRADYAAANREIIAMLKAANAADPAAQHVYDDKPGLGWQLVAADVAITDISAMIYDRLATGKPLLVTRPVSVEAEVDTGGYLGVCEWLHADSAAGVVAELDRVTGDAETVTRLQQWARHYFGSTEQGAATTRFHDAVKRLLAHWAEHAQQHAEEVQVAAERMLEERARWQQRYLED